MGFVVLLIIFPSIIAILSLIGVYYIGIAGILLFSVIISLYFTFGINPVRTYSPNGNMRSISTSKNIKRLALSFVLSIVSLSALHMIFEHFKT